MHPHTHPLRHLAPMALLLLLLAGCKDERHTVSLSFNARMEQPSGDNSKVRLVGEQYVYWEYDDAISIASNTSSTSADAAPAEGYLSGYGGDYADYNGVFLTTLNEGSQYFVGLHPMDSRNRIIPNGESSNRFSAKIYLKPTQPYRDDHSFARQVLPMAAWYGGEWDETHNTPFNLDFHSLAGIVRLQFYNSTGSPHRISSVSLSSPDKQLCGLFRVANLHSFNPHLVPDNNTAETRQLALGMPEGGLDFPADTLRSFYLVLPALHGMDTADTYSLTVRVSTEGGYFERTLSVPVRRNAITYTRAIGITALTPSVTTAVGLVGNGTADRPFKIYSVAELVYVRDSFAHPRSDGHVYLNGQRVTPETHFRIMRSDLELTNSNWSSGIVGFTGHLTYYSTAPGVVHGIANRSTHPLFESIATGGTVEGLTVKCANVTLNLSDPFSPFCRNNAGRIVGCHLVTPPASAPIAHTGGGFAGLCVTNASSGLVEGSSCSAIGSFGSNFGGICYTNNGILRACIAAAPMEVAGPLRAGGICYYNNGTVEDCYSDLHYSSGSTAWGGIVYENNTNRTIRHCYLSASAILHSTTVGGIVCINRGLVDYCWTEGSLRGTTVGGIAATVAEGGRLTNCFLNDSLLVITLNASASAHYAGGLAAILDGGSVSNSFALLNHITRLDITGTYGAAVGHVASGTVDNCYALETNTLTPRFYGDTTEGSPVFSHSYLVGGPQEGVTQIHPQNNRSGDHNDLSDLLSDLRANRASLRDWLRQSQSNTSAPILEPYTPTAAARTIPTAK